MRTLSKRNMWDHFEEAMMGMCMWWRPSRLTELLTEMAGVIGLLGCIACMMVHARAASGC